MSRSPTLRLATIFATAAAVAAFAACRERAYHDQPGPGGTPPADGSAPPPDQGDVAAAPEATPPPWPEDTSPIVARSGAAVVRASRLLIAGRFQQWLDQWAPPDRAVDDWYRSDARIRTLLGSELEYAVLDEQFEREGLTITEADVDAQLARVEPLARIAALPADQRDAAFTPFAPLTWELARGFAYERARLYAWVEAHVHLPDDDTLRAEWLRANDRVSIDVVVVPNVHPDHEIDAFVEQNRSRIEAAYEADAARFTVPAAATIDEVTVSPDLDVETARQRCGELAEVAARVLVGDDAPPAGFVRRTRTVQRLEMPEAFELESGALSDLVDRDGVCARFLVTRRSPRLLRLLDDEIVRELGAEMFARESQDPASERLARQVQDALDDPDALAALGFTSTRTPPFARNSDGHVAGVGNVPALHDAIFAMLREPGDTLPGVWFTAEGWVALRLLERSTASAADFDAARDEFAANWLDLMRRTVWSRFLEQRAAQSPAQFDLPAAVAYLDVFFDALEPEGSQ